MCDLIMYDCWGVISMRFVYLCDSSHLTVSNFQPIVYTCRISILLLMFVHVWSASIRWFAKVDLVVEVMLLCV